MQPSFLGLNTGKNQKLSNEREAREVNNQSLIPSTDMIQLTFTLKMTTARVVKTPVTMSAQWWIQGRGPGGLPPSPYLSQGLDDRLPSSPPPPQSEGLDLQLQQQSYLGLHSAKQSYSTNLILLDYQLLTAFWANVETT